MTTHVPPSDVETGLAHPPPVQANPAQAAAAHAAWRDACAPGGGGVAASAPSAVDQWELASLIDDGRLQAITDFAAKLCEAPIALVSVVGDATQEFLARTGFEPAGTPRAQSFCAYAMQDLEVMTVPDARQDPRFAANPLVTAPGGIRFYAGAPLRLADGTPLGSLCVIDSMPRAGLTPLQLQGLSTLAQSVMTLVMARKAEQESDRRFGDVRGERDEQALLFRVLTDSMPQMVWSTLPDGYHDYYNARWYEFTGMEPGTTDGEGWRDMFHADDQPEAARRWAHSLATGEPYEVEYRLRAADGHYRWVLGRAMPVRAEDGRILRWFGTCTDIHDQKLAMEQREVLTQELSHRIKNIFAVVGGLIGMSLRNHPELQGAADDLRDRVMALGRAHDFVRPHSDASRPSAQPASLHGLLRDLLAPYNDAADGRVVIIGDDVPIDDRSATPLALLFHELATNASKYGGLSSPDGSLTVAVSVAAGDVDIEWTERGGPPAAEPALTGFGSRLIALSVERQLAGTIVRDWDDGGLSVAIRIPAASLHRAKAAGETVRSKSGA